MATLNLVTYIRNIAKEENSDLKLKPDQFNLVNKDIQELLDSFLKQISSFGNKILKPELVSQVLLDDSIRKKEEKEKSKHEEETGETSSEKGKKKNSKLLTIVEINDEYSKYIQGGNDAVITFRKWDNEEHDTDKSCDISAIVNKNNKYLCKAHSEPKKTKNNEEDKTKNEKKEKHRKLNKKEEEKKVKCQQIIKKLYGRGEKGGLNIPPSKIKTYSRNMGYSLSAEMDLFLTGYIENALSDLLSNIEDNKYNEAPWVLKLRENDINEIQKKYNDIEEWEMSSVDNSHTKLLSKIYYDNLKGKLPDSYSNFLHVYNTYDEETEEEDM